MREISEMWAAYQRDKGKPSAPDVPAPVAAFLEGGLVEAIKIDGRRSDPFFACGGDVTYRCRNARGQTMTVLLWGNTDGWGMLEGGL